MRGVGQLPLRFLAETVERPAAVQAEQVLRRLGQHRVVDREGRGEAALAPSERDAEREHAVVVAEVVVQRELSPAAVGARVGVDVAHVRHVAETVAHHALAGGGAEMAAEPPVHELDVFRSPLPDREAAHHHDAVTMVEGALDGGDVFGDRIEGKVAAPDIVEIEPPGPHALHGPVEGGKMPGPEVEGERLLAADRGAGPGRGVIDVVLNHGAPERGGPASRRSGLPYRREWRPDAPDRV